MNPFGQFLQASRDCLGKNKARKAPRLELGNRRSILLSYRVTWGTFAAFSMAIPVLAVSSQEVCSAAIKLSVDR
jgi:hypothetical protein